MGDLSIMWLQLIILPVLLLGFIISVTILGAYIEYKVRKEYEERCNNNASGNEADNNVDCFIDNK